MKKRNGFTLIELLAVIVILAIIALIAVPLVLKYINNAKKGSNEVSVQSIARAAENYYASSLLKKDVTYPKKINFPDSKNELGLKGRQPDSGYVEIYEDGTQQIFVTYDGQNYIMLKGDNDVINDKFIATSDEWLSDGNGYAYYYKKNSELTSSKNDVETIIGQLDSCLDKSDKEERKTCINNVDISKAPANIQKELKNYKALAISFLDTDVEPSEDELNEKIPTILKIMNGEYDESLFDFKVNDFYIPSVIVHNDKTLEKITSIGGKTITKEDGSEVTYMPFISSEDSEPISKSVKNLIVPNTLEKIEDIAFLQQNIGNIDFSQAKSLKKIGSAAFYENQILTRVSIPASVEEIENSAFGEIPTLSNLTFMGATDGTSKLKTIGDSAFAQDYSTPCGGTMPGTTRPCSSPGYLMGTLHIPASVETIGSSAFAGMNNLTVVFEGAEDGTSKLKNVGNYAFYDIANKNSISLPSSVTNIGKNVFK